MTLIWILFLPLLWPWIAKYVWHRHINYTELAINCLSVAVIVSIVYVLGMYGQTSDTEIWNGKVVSKDRDHGHYIESYSCNCRTVSCGKNCTTTRCDTCYRDHYTVTWTAKTTVGGIQFAHKDSTWRSVYNSPDPKSYVKCVIGEPASIEHNYTNYVLAVPGSLFNTYQEEYGYDKEKIPPYPRVYNFYKVMRVINVDGKIPVAQVRELNQRLNMMLREVGPKKQANVIVILTEIDDQGYRHAIEGAWLGGKKNDIVIFLGLDGNKYTWVDIMTWALNSGNEYFQVILRDALLKQKTFNPVQITKSVKEVILDKFDRPQMSDYEYLKDQIKPPTWVIVLALVLGLSVSIGLSIFFARPDVDIDFTR